MSLNSIYALPGGERLAPRDPEVYFKSEVRASPQGYRGLFALEPIKARAVVAREGGVVVTSVDDVPPEKAYSALIAPGLFLAPNDYDHPEDSCFINHSCASNLMRIGGLILVARRDIAAGEELTLDYAPLIAGVAGWKLACRCPAPDCRGTITSRDWENPVLAEFFWEEWLPHTQKDILKNKSP